MTEPLERFSRQIGYQFKEREILEQALTHRSVGNPNNERLEFLGDAILGFFVADALYRKVPTAREGQLSRLRARLVKKDTLAKIAKGLALGEYLRLGAGELRSGGHARDSILADAMEAVLAAVYLDGGYLAAQEVVHNLLRTHLRNLSVDSQEKDPKTCLQEYLQARRLALPMYTILEVSGEHHAQRFEVECKVADLEVSCRGRGSSRKEAEQDAASRVLEELRV